MQQAKYKRDDPRFALRQPGSALANMHDLTGDKHDRERNHGLDGRLWNLHKAERGGRQGQAVRSGECRNCPD